MHNFFHWRSQKTHILEIHWIILFLKENTLWFKKKKKKKKLFWQYSKYLDVSSELIGETCRYFPSCNHWTNFPFYFSPNQLTNFTVFSYNWMTKFTTPLPPPLINWQISWFFSCWKTMKFHIIFHDRLAILPFHLASDWRNSQCFSHIQLKIFANIFLRWIDKFQDYFVVTNQWILHFPS